MLPGGRMDLFCPQFLFSQAAYPAACSLTACLGSPAPYLSLFPPQAGGKRRGGSSLDTSPCTIDSLTLQSSYGLAAKTSAHSSYTLSSHSPGRVVRKPAQANKVGARPTTTTTPAIPGIGRSSQAANSSWPTTTAASRQRQKEQRQKSVSGGEKTPPSCWARQLASTQKDKGERPNDRNRNGS